MNNVDLPLAIFAAYTASDYSMLIWTVSSALVMIINAVGVFVLIYLQIKYRKSGDPPIDVIKQIGALQQGLKMNTERLETHSTLITEVAAKVPVQGPVGPTGATGATGAPGTNGGEPTKIDLTLHGDKT